MKLKAWFKNEKKMLNVTILNMEDEIICGYDENDKYYENVNMYHFELLRPVGLCDKHGKPIYEYNVLQFEDKYGIWIAPVIFNSGVATIDFYSVKQIKNPKGWDREYNMVETNSFCLYWGIIREWHKPPIPLAEQKIADVSEYRKKKLKFRSHWINAEIICDYYEECELLNLNELKG